MLMDEFCAFLLVGGILLPRAPSKDLDIVLEHREAIRALGVRYFYETKAEFDARHTGREYINQFVLRKPLTVEQAKSIGCVF